MSTNTGSNTGKLNEMIKGLGGISQASQAQTGGERAMGIAQTIGAIMELIA